MNAVVLGPAGGERHDLGASSVTTKAGGEHTGGTMFVAQTVIAAGFAGPPPHSHEPLHDMFYVLDGVLTVRLGTETIEAKQGSFVCVPPGVVHTFSNCSDGPVRFLNMNTPSGWESYMRTSHENCHETGRRRPKRSAGSHRATTFTRALGPRQRRYATRVGLQRARAGDVRASRVGRAGGYASYPAFLQT